MRLVLVIPVLAYLIVAVAAAFMALRVRKVFAYRMQVLELVHLLSKEDITAGRDWTRRYEALDDVGFDEMMWKFWQPVDSFFTGHPALEEGPMPPRPSAVQSITIT